MGLAATAACAAAAAAGMKVAIVPVVNVSGQQWEALKARQDNGCNDYLRNQFEGHGFDLVPPENILTEMRSQGVDFKDDESSRRDNLRAIGRAVKADYVILAMITDSNASKESHLIFNDEVGHATARVWIVDVAHGNVLMSGDRITSESGGTRLTYNSRGSDREVQAAINAMRDGFGEFLAKFPAKPVKGRRT